MKYLATLFLRLEAGMHRTDAYLAQLRGDLAAAADSTVRALECERRIDLMEINYRGTR